MSFTTQVLHGKVIKILDEFRVVVDIGHKDGIKKDMKFFIYEYGEEIHDPITNEIIDKIEIVKHHIKVTHIQEKFSIMRSDEYEEPYIIGSVFAKTFQLRTIPFSTETKPLKSSPEGYKIVKVGDLVRQDFPE